MKKRLIYSNPLREEADIKDFVLEGSASLSFPNQRLRMENMLSPKLMQKANYVLWCRKEFPADVAIEWDFWPVREPGLAMMFFSAKGRNGEDLFDKSLAVREGDYASYHHSDINAFHVSYFRRKEPDERRFHTCNLRKSYGLHLVCQGADPLPDAKEADGPYHIRIVKQGNRIEFYIDGLLIFSFLDDGETYGTLLAGGKIGFRQLAPMVGEYADLKVYEITEEGEIFNQQ